MGRRLKKGKQILANTETVWVKANRGIAEAWQRDEGLRVTMRGQLQGMRRMWKGCPKAAGGGREREREEWKGGGMKKVVQSPEDGSRQGKGN